LLRVVGDNTNNGRRGGDAVPQPRPRENESDVEYAMRCIPSIVGFRQAAPQRGALWVDMIVYFYSVPEERIVQMIGTAQRIPTACRDTHPMFSIHKMFRWNMKKYCDCFFAACLCFELLVITPTTAENLS